MILDQVSGALATGAGVNMLSDMLRLLFFSIDALVYALIPAIYNMIFSLYDISALIDKSTMSNVFETITNSIYSFLAVFMFFRVAFSLITMIVDPSLIDDKEKGLKKIVTNIMICLVLIVVVPYIFKYASQIQSKIVEEKLIEKVVTGTTYDEDYSLGNELALSVWSVFLRPSDSSATGDAINAYNNVFKSGSESWNFGSLWDSLNDVTGSRGILSFGTKGSYYTLSYTVIFPTIIGIYIAWTFFKMMIDIAYRALKFFVLELMSPIAIISYIDPGSAKKGIFNKWMGECVKTYLSLFIRIFVFSFVSVLLRSIEFKDVSWLNLFYILAIIAFIKNAPKFIDDIFGTSMSKESDAASAKHMLGGIMSAGIGAAAGGISNAVVAKRVGRSALKAGLSGAYSGMKKGYGAGKKGGLGGLTGTVSSAYGSYGDALKKYGYEEDKEQEKLIEKLRLKVGAVNSAKSAAVSNLEANNYEAYMKKLTDGPKVNGRKYGKGLENDDGLENLLKKNAGGLAQDELLHEGDEEYLKLRRAVAKAKDDEVIVARTSALAKESYSSSRDAFNGAEDKRSFAISFETDTTRMKYSEMNANDLTNSFRSELQAQADTFVKLQSRSFDNASKDQKVNIVASLTGKDASNYISLSDKDLKAEFDSAVLAKAQLNINDKVKSFNSASSTQDKINVALGVRQENISYDISSISDAGLASRFDVANEDRIKTEFGHSLANIESDNAKASGDAKKAQEALDTYFKSGKGKKAKTIDNAFSIADAREKAKALDEKRKAEQQQNNGKI